MTTFRELMREVTGPTVADAVPTAAPLLVGADVPLDSFGDGLYLKSDGTVWIRAGSGDSQIGGGNPVVKTTIGYADLVSAFGGAAAPWIDVEAGQSIVVWYGLVTEVFNDSGAASASPQVVTGDGATAVFTVESLTVVTATDFQSGNSGFHFVDITNGGPEPRAYVFYFVDAQTLYFAAAPWSFDGTTGSLDLYHQVLFA